MNPLFESLFHDASFGFRQGRNCHQALEAALGRISKLLETVADAAQRPLSVRWTRAGLSQRDNLYQQLRDAPAALRYHHEGFAFVVDADITGFFDNLPHNVIMEAVAAQVADGNILSLIEKVRALTHRSHNCEAQVFVNLNRVIRGTAQYFATRWFTGREIFHKLDSWVRMRLRCMKFKCLNYEDNRKLRVRYYQQLGLLSLESFCIGRPETY